MNERLGILAILFLPSTQRKSGSENIWCRRRSYFARSMFVWLSRPNRGADNENFRSNVSLLEGEKANERGGQKQGPQKKFRAWLKVSGGFVGLFWGL